MSDTNRVGMSYIAESSWGTTPSGNLQRMRFTGETLQQQTEIARSAEIRSDRQLADIARVNAFVAGVINGEISYGAWDDWIQSALFSSAWSSQVTITAATISAATADNSFNDSGSGFGSYVANQWVRVTGFVNSANNGFFKIVSATSSKIVVTGGTLVNASASPSITIRQGPYITNGTTMKSFSIEKEFADLSSVFTAARGIVPDQAAINIAAGSLATCAFTVIGKAETNESATIGTGYTAAPTNDIMNCVDNVSKVVEALSSVDITALSINIANNLRRRNKVAQLGPISLGTGVCNVTGNVSLYFESNALATKYLAFTSTSLAVALMDGSNNAYVFEMPKVKLTSSPRNAQAQNNDVIVTANYEAFRDPTEGVTLKIARFPA